MNRFQTPGKMKVIKGTILAPENAGLRFVLNVNNLVGKTDSPMYNVFDKKWRIVREAAKGWYNNRTGAYKIGAVNTTAVQSDTWVLHMLCQDEKLNTNINGLEECLNKICGMAKYEKATVHVSHILVEAIPELTTLLSKYLIEQGVSVYFYE